MGVASSWVSAMGDMLIELVLEFVKFVNDCMFWRVERKRRPASLSEIFMPVVTMKLVPLYPLVLFSAHENA